MTKKDVEIESLQLRINRVKEACFSGIKTYTDNIKIVKESNHPKEWIEEFQEKRAIYKEILEIVDPEAFFIYLTSSSKVTKEDKV